MEIKGDFSKIWATVDEIGASRLKITVELGKKKATDKIKKILIEGGVPVDITEIVDYNSFLAIKTPDNELHQIVLYIPDQGKDFLDVVNGNKELGKKFHLAHCPTLEKMKNNGRFQRYVASTNPSGRFKVNGINEHGQTVEASDVELYVCINCLNMLNYKRAKTTRAGKTIRTKFDIAEFFETYQSIFSEIPKRTDSNIGRASYTEDWISISNLIRSKVNWICSKCKVDLSNNRNLLHVHHINGLKDDNHSQNLVPLCACCHKQQAMHEHLNVCAQDIRQIKRLRNKQDGKQVDWPTILDMADPAFCDVLDLIYSKGWPVPELEYLIPSTKVFLDMAWPENRIGIALSPSDDTPDGWKIMNLTEVLHYWD